MADRTLSALRTYRDKRNFDLTPEPADGGTPGKTRVFVVQKHWASHLHYDFRLALDGTMKSWAVPKGPSLDPRDKRMAVQVEDHPIAYNQFEGTIPPGQYGAGKVIIWDKGTWLPLEDPRKGYLAGKLKFELRGHKLHGHWALVRMKGRGGSKEAWLLIKEQDEWARPASEFSVVDEMPDSVKSRDDLPENTRPGVRAAQPTGAPGGGPPAGARPCALPREPFQPQLATLVDQPPQDGRDWLYEIKFDGYRLLTRVQHGSVRCFTRNRHDWTHKLPQLVKALGAMDLPEGWYDGEIVLPGEHGIADFQALQGAFDSERTDGIVYYLFDLPFCAGQDLRQVPLVARREVLQRIVQRKPSDQVRFSDVFDAPPQDVVASACKLGLEGIIAKRRNSAYVQRRSTDWIKLKCGQRQEFVIGGWTEPQGSRTGMGALLLGVHGRKDGLTYAGNVGTGFSEKVLRDLRKRLDALAADRSPFAADTAVAGKPHWVRPELVCEVSFAEWTREGRIRHSVFHGLRSDKPARAIEREQAHHNAPPDKPAKVSATPPSALPASLQVSHPERIVDAASGATKMDMVRYYALVAPLILEHLKGRPVSLVRAPDGVGGELFFQKHLGKYKMPGVHELDTALDPGHEPLLEISTAQGLLSAAQMNVLEFHTWNAVRTSIGKPDRMTFDLDPGEGVAWPQVQEAAQLVRAFLTELGLPAFLKTSGGKGLHVVVPLRRQLDWDAVKGFSEDVVAHIAHAVPQRFVAKSGPRNRVGRIFIDYLRNGFGATTVAAWSARARPGLGISVPVAWEELDKLKGGAHWTVGTVHTRLDQGNRPWADYDKSRVGLGAAIRKLPASRGTGH